MEAWLPIAWAPGYEVSDQGGIRRRLVRQNRKRGRFYRLLRGSKDTKGYFQIRLVGTQPVGRLYFVHRLVAEAFLGPCPVGHEIDHRDATPTNNRVTNLEYVTHSENIRRWHARRRHGRAQAV